MKFNAETLKFRLFRTKSTDPVSANVPISGKLPKCLSTLDMVSLGVGSCVGTGMYVVSGLVAREMAGPGVILSFIIAALASVLSGVCYAEFGVRVPQTTGSAYVYSYVTVGEFVAFIIGWNLILEYLIGTAAGASALSSCFDSLARKKYSTFMKENVGEFGIHSMSYPDLLACIIAICMTLIVTAGLKKSVGFNNILNAINFTVWVFIVIAGLFFVNINNWTYDGFLPHGFSGVLQGAATCFYAFIGFDIIATTGEEAREPSRSIPKAIILSLLVCLMAYVSVSIILTLMVPYNTIPEGSPLMEIFSANHAQGAKYVVAIGAICGLTVSLLGSLFPMPRIIYAMALDGLLFRFFARINSHTQTPAVATLLSGFLAAILALLVGLGDLIEMMSIGTLLAYTLVSMCVLILRYQPHRELNLALQTMNYQMFENEEDDGSDRSEVGQTTPTSSKDTTRKLLPNIPGLVKDTDEFPQTNYGAITTDSSLYNLTTANPRISRLQEWINNKSDALRRIFNFPDTKDMPTPETGKAVTITTILLFFFVLCFSSLVIYGRQYLAEAQPWAVLILMLLILILLGCIIRIFQQPQNPERLSFMVPCVPILPIAAIFINVYLMLKLSYLTWIRFGIWLFIGLVTYFGYGMWNSNMEGRCKDSGGFRRNSDGKETLILDHPSPEVTTESETIPAHLSKAVKSPPVRPRKLPLEGATKEDDLINNDVDGE